MLKVALTGGIATGKIYVLARLKDRGVPTIDADDIVHEALGAGTPTTSAIATQFGSGFLKPDGSVDRALLGAEGVQRSLRPAGNSRRSSIRSSTKRFATGSTRSIARWAWRRSRCCTKQAAKSDFDFVAVTVCPPEMQLQRLLERDGMSEEEARQRIAAQMPAEEKAARGNFVIRPAARSSPPTARSTSC